MTSEIKINGGNLSEIITQHQDNYKDCQKIKIMGKYSNKSQNSTYDSKQKNEFESKPKVQEKIADSCYKRKSRSRCKSSHHSTQRYIKLDISKTECKLKLKKYLDNKMKIEEIKRKFAEFRHKSSTIYR